MHATKYKCKYRHVNARECAYNQASISHLTYKVVKYIAKRWHFIFNAYNNSCVSPFLWNDAAKSKPELSRFGHRENSMKTKLKNSKNAFPKLHKRNYN